MDNLLPREAFYRLGELFAAVEDPTLDGDCTRYIATAPPRTDRGATTVPTDKKPGEDEGKKESAAEKVAAVNVWILCLVVYMLRQW